MDRQYDAWNLAIGKHFFGSKCARQLVILTVDEATLWQIGQQYGESLLFDTFTDTVNDFAASARREVYAHGWTMGALQVDRYPRFLGLLAVQVLAAFRMRDDDVWRETAYWARLRGLLKDSHARYMPLGLTIDQHQQLWHYGLERWANVVQEGRWGIVCLPPQEQPGERRDHVSLPKSQALLSLADLNRLSNFYREADFKPGEDVEVDLIREQVEKLLAKPSIFQGHARKVLQDERLIPACAQIREHLFHWPGDDTVGTVRLWLQLSENPPELVGGLGAGRTIQLEEVLGRSRYQSGSQGTFRPIRTTGYVMVLQNFREVWEERRYAKPGDDVVLLVRSEEFRSWMAAVHLVAEAEVLIYYAENEMADSKAKKLKGLPRGWRALHLRICEGLPAHFPRWIHCAIIQPIGGLRVDRNTWMAGAGPTLLVRVADIHTVGIDGHEYPVVNRRVTPQQAPCLDEAGMHSIYVWGKTDRIIITIQESAVSTGIPVARGWVQQGREWPMPEWFSQDLHPESSKVHDSLTVRGPAVLGNLAKITAPELPVQRQWLELVRRLRGYRLAATSSRSQPLEMLKHPLLRQMRMASK